MSLWVPIPPTMFLFTSGQVLIDWESPSSWDHTYIGLQEARQMLPPFLCTPISSFQILEMYYKRYARRRPESLSQSLHLHLSRSQADIWGIIVDLTTSFLHSLRFSALGSMIFHSRPVHFLMLSSHRFLCLLLRLPPWTVPCRIVLASPDDRVTCPYRHGN